MNEPGTGPQLENNTYVIKPEYSNRSIDSSEQGLKHPYPALNKTSAYLNENVPRYILVQVGEYGGKISLPLVSLGFKYCDALVLRDKKEPCLRGIAHIVSGTDPAEFVKALASLLDSSQLEALIISAGGERKKLVEALGDMKIPIISVVNNPEREQNKANQHDIVVLPHSIIDIDESKTQEILF